MWVVRRIMIGVCALVAVCALVLFALSHRNRLFVGWQRMERGAAPDCHSVELFATRGSVGLEVYARDTFWVSTIQLTPPEWWYRDGLYAGRSAAHPVAAMSPQGSFGRFGFHVHHENSIGGPPEPRAVVLRHTVVAVPLWLVALLAGIPPAVGLLRRWRSRRQGRCPGCGYDVRATPHRCPECGRNLSGASSTVISS